MSEQWEYCELRLLRQKVGETSYQCEMYIRFFGAGARWLSRVKGNDAESWQHNVWETAIAELGRVEWEMVGVQHANVAGDMGGGGGIDEGNAVAYFKRTTKEGRRVDEPAILVK